MDNIMEIKPIKTEEDYQKALAEIERLFEAEPNTPEQDYLEVLVTLVEAYEKVNYPINYPDPIEAILYYLDSRGLSIEALQEEIDSTINLTAILNRQAVLSLDAIRQLHSHLGIPAEVLIQSYPLGV
jgi:HTH-type transcriptional regulator/antitoxin HigA